MNKEEEIKRGNEEIAERFNRIEVKLPASRDIAGFFETLFTGIENEFKVPFVWLTLMNTKKGAPIIAAIKSSNILKNRLSVITPELFSQILPPGIKPVLVNKDLQPYYKLLPSRNKYFVKSLALVPFKVNDEIVGSWNNGDAAADRYEPDMETDLLQKFAESVSRRLTELIDADS
ncbi:MAG: hypothetical protein A2W27_06265 [Deltaproteobacteria bacterium RBG_16_44_11]|nr:MAG: hypothetical protein A2W27_06265 [Deltaproteobacteria bacterium RBG_16_44_11]